MHICIWAAPGENVVSGNSRQRRAKLAHASAQSDQNLRCPLTGPFDTRKCTMERANVLMNLNLWSLGISVGNTVINNSPKFSIKALQYLLLDFDKGNGQLIFYV